MLTMDKKRIAAVFNTDDLDGYLKREGGYRLAWIAGTHIDLVEKLAAVPTPCHLSCCGWDSPNWEGDPVVLLDSAINNNSLDELTQWVDRRHNWWWGWYSNLSRIIQSVACIYLGVKGPLTKDTMLAARRDWVSAKKVIKTLSYRFTFNEDNGWDDILKAAVVGRLPDVIKKYEHKAAELMSRWNALPQTTREESSHQNMMDILEWYGLEEWLDGQEKLPVGSYFLDNEGYVYRVVAPDRHVEHGGRVVHGKVPNGTLVTTTVHRDQVLIGHTVVLHRLLTVIVVKPDGMVKLSDQSWYVLDDTVQILMSTKDA